MSTRLLEVRATDVVEFIVVLGVLRGALRSTSRDTLADRTLSEQLLRLRHSDPLTTPGPCQSGRLGTIEHDGTGDRVVVTDNSEVGRSHQHFSGCRVLGEETVRGTGNPVDPPVDIHGVEQVSFEICLQSTVYRHAVGDDTAGTRDMDEM